MAGLSVASFQEEALGGPSAMRPVHLRQAKFVRRLVHEDDALRGVRVFGEESGDGDPGFVADGVPLRCHRIDVQA